MGKEALQHSSLILIAGWKDVSLIDVPGEPTFILWLCGCNLKCPFCHNYKIAEAFSDVCRYMSINDVVSIVERASRLVTTIQLSGGEPLLQINAVLRLLRSIRSRLPSIKISINTNCTLPHNLELLLREELIDHIATDVKIPFDKLSGLNSTNADMLWARFKECLRLLSRYEVMVELRIPVSKGLVEPSKVVDKVYDLVLESRLSRYYIVVNSLKGPPLISYVRNIRWCSKFCNPPEEIVRTIASKLRERGLNVLKVIT